MACGALDARFRAVHDPSTGTTRVGVRKLRPNLSVYLRRIRRGERFEVMDRGRRFGLADARPQGCFPPERLVRKAVRGSRGESAGFAHPAGVASTTVSQSQRRPQSRHLAVCGPRDSPRTSLTVGVSYRIQPRKRYNFALFARVAEHCSGA